MPGLSRCWVMDLSRLNERMACQFAYMNPPTPDPAALFPCQLMVN
jgi:hypothetical protein